MAIAHVVQEEDSASMFLDAEHPEQLRHLLLMSRRKRHARIR